MGFFRRNSEQPERKPSEKGHKELLDAQILAMKAKGDEFDEEILHHVNSAMREGLSLYDEAMAHYLLGDVYENQKRFKEAETETKRALELNEISVKKLDMLLYHSAWVRLGVIYIVTDCPDKAIKCFQESVETLPIKYGGEEGLEGTLALGYCQLANAYLAVFEERWGIERVSYYLQKAIESAHKAIEAYAKYSESYEILGDIYGTEKWGSLHNPFYEPIEAKKFYIEYLATESIGEEDRERVRKKLKNLM